MALKKKGEYSYGDSQADIRAELIAYGRASGDLPIHFADARCNCGGRAFLVLLDDEEGVAVRVCDACGDRHPMGDSAEYSHEAEPEECECTCGGMTFEATVGVSLYADSLDVKWLFLGLRCIRCGLTACFGDWKNEYIGYQDLLRKI